MFNFGCTIVYDIQSLSSSHTNARCRYQIVSTTVAWEEGGLNKDIPQILMWKNIIPSERGKCKFLQFSHTDIVNIATINPGVFCWYFQAKKGWKCTCFWYSYWKRLTPYVVLFYVICLVDHDSSNLYETTWYLSHLNTLASFVRVSLWWTWVRSLD